MAKIRIKKGDEVVVIRGADRSESPRKVLEVNVADGRVIVEGTNMRWKHNKKSQQNPQGGRIEKEFPIAISNVMLFSPKAKRGVRTRIEMVDGKKVRVGTCGHRFD